MTTEAYLVTSLHSERISRISPSLSFHYPSMVPKNTKLTEDTELNHDSVSIPGIR